jgi:hypothetical protein
LLFWKVKMYVDSFIDTAFNSSNFITCRARRITYRST